MKTHRSDDRSATNTRRSFLFTSTALGVSSLLGCEPAKPPVWTPDQRTDTDHAAKSTAVRKGVDWLLAQQHEDGAWRSVTYGQMRGGAGNTALILYALAHLPQDERERAQPAIDRATQFLLKTLHKTGYVQDSTGASDYPTYATALLLSAMSRMQITAWADERQRMRDYLIASQLGKRHRLKPEDLDFGGWNQTGGDPTEAVPASTSNISVTSIALEALAVSGGVPEPVSAAALSYLKRLEHQEMRNDNAWPDVSYHFTPRADDFRNKAGWLLDKTGEPVARPYGTATADGLVALLDCGVLESDERPDGAVSWLLRHYSFGVADFPTMEGTTVLGGDATMSEGLWFYERFAFKRIGRVWETKATTHLRNRDVARLIELQRHDGSWQNESNAMREDDPLIATAFALTALGR